MLSLQQVIYERPPEGLARGLRHAPWWVIVILAAFVVVASGLFLLIRFIMAMRAARGPSQPPPT